MTDASNVSNLTPRPRAAKATKQTINRKRIYPPLSGSKDELFAAAAPTVQAPPPTYGTPRR